MGITDSYEMAPPLRMNKQSTMDTSVPVPSPQTRVPSVTQLHGWSCSLGLGMCL